MDLLVRRRQISDSARYGQDCESDFSRHAWKIVGRTLVWYELLMR